MHPIKGPHRESQYAFTKPFYGSSNIWIPKCNSMRTRSGRAEPEIYFRIVHTAQDSHNVAPVATYREQAVEIALGPKGVFEYGNIGALRRRVAIAKVVSAAPHQRGIPKPPKKSETPRVVELLRKAIEWQTLLESGKISNQADIGRREGISRARDTQIMALLRLAPEIHEQILSMPAVAQRHSVSERILRSINTIADSRAQLLKFQKLLV
jgi:hypothetical protein